MVKQRFFFKPESCLSSNTPMPIDVSKFKVIKDDFMEEQGCKIYQDELRGQVNIFRRGKFLTTARTVAFFRILQIFDLMLTSETSKRKRIWHFGTLQS
ncbi:MAG: hypothetical protein EZS28_021607 [Streblomastix strix]|uniref:Uncharacterized protein n=1 Tax=Streblomastix strix TaxID=222440 RepID=A0A5J4VJQ7_9EUKA|nr:MAG: hypothetical protein EZS28_021607 [Streblomastix strix]